jgi:hypothetical protein
MVRSRDDARTAALRAEVVALRATVAELRAELAWMTRAAAEATEAAELAQRATAAPTAMPKSVEQAAENGWVTLQMPLVKMALGDPDAVATGPDVAAALASPDRGEDTVEIELVLEPSPPPADRLAWSVLANLPEGRLLDPRVDRDQQPVDHSREAAAVVEATRTPDRRTA